MLFLRTHRVHLEVIYDRGLIGTYHDWCEAFSTYPRTYDLLHVDGLFTAKSHRCEMRFVLVEIDRILRPKGFAFIREAHYFMDTIVTIAEGMRWECHREDSEDGCNSKRLEMILICQKKLLYFSKKNSS